MLSLTITGFDADPDRVTEILGISPTSVARKGEPGLSGRSSTFNGWWLDAHKEPLTSGADLDAGLKRILAHLAGHARRFSALRAELKPEQIHIYGGFYVRPDAQCGLWLEPEQMRVLAECGVGWGLDVFVETSLG